MRGRGARAGPVAGSLLAAVLVLGAGCAGVGRGQPSPLTAEEENDLGVLLYTRGEPARAAAAFARAVALRPGWARALANLGDARLALGGVDLAIDAYETARRAAPEDPAIANNLAWALLQHADRWPEAEAVIAAALARNPEPRGFYLDTLGVLRLRQGAHREALAAFRAALGDPGLPAGATRALVLDHAAEALAGLGDWTGASRCRDRARQATSGWAPVVPVGGVSPVGDRNPVC